MKRSGPRILLHLEGKKSCRLPLRTTRGTSRFCTLSGIEFLVSWNFKHLTNLRREAGFNAVNSLQGFPSLRIVAPTFLIHGYEKEKEL